VKEARKKKIQSLYYFPLCQLVDLQYQMLRSVISTTTKSRFTPALTVRALSTSIQPPKTPVNLAHLSDNHGAVSEVTLHNNCLIISID
jgi:hypothetical protein